MPKKRVQRILWMGQEVEVEVGDLNSTECPGEIVERGLGGRELSRTPCGAIITFGTRMCRRCKTYFAPGSLTAFRFPTHAKVGIKRSWVIRYLRG